MPSRIALAIRLTSRNTKIIPMPISKTSEPNIATHPREEFAYWVNRAFVVQTRHAFGEGPQHTSTAKRKSSRFSTVRSGSCLAEIKSRTSRLRRRGGSRESLRKTRVPHVSRCSRHGNHERPFLARILPTGFSSATILGDSPESPARNEKEPSFLGKACRLRGTCISLR